MNIKKSREISGKDIMNFVVSKWWLYLCTFLISTVFGIIWQYMETNNEIILTDEEKEELDVYIFEQGQSETMNLYKEESIYMNIDPYGEICSSIFLHINDSGDSYGMVVDLKRMLENGELVQEAADMLDIEEKYLNEVISFDISALGDSNEYICEIFIKSSNVEQADSFKGTVVEILRRDVFNKYNENIYTFNENRMEKVDEDLLLYQERYYEAKKIMEAQLNLSKSNLNERQLMTLNNLQTINSSYNIGAVVKIVLAVVVLTCLAVIIFFILSDRIYTEKDVETALGLKPFSVEKKEEVARQITGYAQHRGITKICCLNESEKQLKEVMMFVDRLKEYSLEVENLSKFEMDYRKTECSNYIVCVKKGKTKLNALYPLLDYCEEMNYQILGVVIF